MLELREDLHQKIFAYDARKVANQRHMLTQTQLPKALLTIPGEPQQKFIFDKGSKKLY